MRVRSLFLCKFYSCDFLNTASVLPNLTYAGVDTRANLTLFAEIWPASRALKFSARVRRILLAKKWKLQNGRYVGIIPNLAHTISLAFMVAAGRAAQI